MASPFLASAQLGDSTTGHLTYFAGACPVALLVDTIAIGWHNPQQRGRGPDGLPTAAPGVGARPAAP